MRKSILNFTKASTQSASRIQFSPIQTESHILTSWSLSF